MKTIEKKDSQAFSVSTDQAERAPTKSIKKGVYTMSMRASRSTCGHESEAEMTFTECSKAAEVNPEVAFAVSKE